MKRYLHSMARRGALVLLAGAWLAAAPPALAAEPEAITLASTTSTRDSGLFDYLLPRFTEATGITVRVVAVGTGQALDMGKRCDADALLVHAKPTELRYVQDGFGVDRHDVMYNDFIIVGPAADPAHVADAPSVVAALTRIRDRAAPFVSRGDNSGTHKKELALWKAAGIDPAPASGTWYREAGSGMGATLNTALGMGGYTLVDRATWISFKNRSDYRIVAEGDPELFNQYGAMLVNPARCPQARTAPATRFVDWLISAPGQETIAAYELQGVQLFHPNAD